MGDIKVKEKYLALNLLLEDTCKFLSGDTFQSFSPDDKQIASELIHRTKKQLEELPKLLPKTHENEEYVDMSKNYSTINESSESRRENLNNRNNEASIIQAMKFKAECPYADLPADLASQGGQSGHLWIRKRLFLKQKLFVALHSYWLLLYTNTAESKPFHLFNLKFCKACELEKNCRSFVLACCKNGEKKNYIFMTKTPDTAAEWVKNINICHFNGQPNSIRDQEYDLIEPKPEVEENIYNEPEMICSKLQPSPIVEPDQNETKPPLPPGRGLIPPPPLWRNFRTSLVSYNEVEDDDHDNSENQNVEVESDDKSIFESKNFEDSIFKSNKTENEDIIKVSKNSNSMTSFCPFSKKPTVKSDNNEECETFEEKKLKVKDSILRSFSQRNNN